MKAHAARRGPPPEVDEGDARNLVALLRRELRPTPGRLGDSVRILLDSPPDDLMRYGATAVIVIEK